LNSSGFHLAIASLIQTNKNAHTERICTNEFKLSLNQAAKPVTTENHPVSELELVESKTLLSVIHNNAFIVVSLPKVFNHGLAAMFALVCSTIHSDIFAIFKASEQAEELGSIQAFLASALFISAIASLQAKLSHLLHSAVTLSIPLSISF